MPSANRARHGSRPGKPESNALRRILAALLTALLATACSRVDIEQARICEIVIPAIVDGDRVIEVLDREVDSSAANAVIVRYRLKDSADGGDARWLSCRFAGSALQSDRLDLAGIVTDREGALSETRVAILKRFWLGRMESLATVGDREPASGRSPLRKVLVFLQQTVNASIVCSVYALLAMAYALVYAIVGRINLAFGELLMIGAYVALLGVHLFAFATAVLLPLVVAAVLVLAATMVAAYGVAIRQIVFRPLQGRTSQAVLIATVGLALALQEFVHLVQGPRERWLQPVLSEVHILGSAGGFTLTVTTFQLVIATIAIGLYVGHRRIVDRSTFGMGWRAAAQDADMAALCGIDVGRTILLTFALSAAYAGLAGGMVALHYGGVSFHMGTVFGFKALTAAVIGGIGSVPGAALGGILIGLVETFWSGYLTSAYRDIVVFGLLAAVLVFRPEGLLRRPGVGTRQV